MATVSSDKIIQIVRKNSDGMTATAIAHELGFSKASSIKDALSDAVDSGSITVDNSGRYDIYKYVKSAVSKSESNVPAGDSKVTVVKGEKPVTNIPEADDYSLRGYKVDSIKVEGKEMKKVTTPDGKKLRMENDEKLLVINNEPKYVVKTADDVISSIRKYAVDQGLTVFTVDDIKQNRKVSNDKDVVIKDDHILFLSIKKHNKAA